MTTDDICEIYHQRGGIETNYNTLKKQILHRKLHWKTTNNHRTRHLLKVYPIQYILPL